MYLDLTYNFIDGMTVWPGDPAPQIQQISTVAKDGVAHFEVKTGMHAGTHIDSPAHMLMGGKMLSEYPPEKFFGRGVCLDARGKKSADAELLLNVQINKGDIVLVCFGWSSEFGQDEYYLNYPEISESLATRLVELGASIVGSDTCSPDRAPYRTHKILLGRDVLIMENLTNLEQ